jgi:DedD protein
MEEKNELGDIILNKNSNQGGNKKVILAAATLGVILIVVVLLMNSLSSEEQNNLPQKTALPPKPVATPQVTQDTTQKEEPMFEDAEIIDEDLMAEDDAETKKLEEIAKKLKKQSAEQPKQHVVKHEPKPQPKHVAQPKKEVKKVATHTTTPKKATHGKKYYVQVGSFTRSPNKDLIKSIKATGYNYRFYKTVINGRHITKVLIGSFRNEKEARYALKKVRRLVVKDAFVVKL